MVNRGNRPARRGPAVVIGAALGVATLTVLPRAVVAQTEAESRAAARALGVEGISLAMEGNCPAAIPKLERAETLYHAPTILGRLGECQVEVGQLVAGTENLQRVVRESLGPNPPSAFIEAQERARKVLDLALPRIAKLTVEITAPPGVVYEVTLNGKPLPPALLGIERPIDPGDYVIAVGGAGVAPAEQSVTLADGARESVELTVEATAADAIPEAGSVPATTTSPGTASGLGAPASPVADEGAGKGGAQRGVGLVLLGVGGVGVIVGGAFGLRATSKRSGLDDTCVAGACPASAADDIDAMKSAAQLSTLGFGIGLGAAAVGTVLVLTASPSGRRDAARGDRELQAGVQGFMGLEGVGVRGRF